MDDITTTDDQAQLKELITSLLAGKLSEEDARLIYQMGPEAVILLILAANRKFAEQDQEHPSTPSGQKPVYTKPARKKRKNRRGAKKGHRGSRRPEPERIDRKEEHRLEHCPDCGSRLKRCEQKRTRTVEDIIKDLSPEIVEHTIHRDYCPCCKKHVEPKVPDALPKASIGHRLVILTSWLHYSLGVTFNQISELLQGHLHTRLTNGGMFNMWLRIARIFEPWYEKIAEDAKNSAVLHADETGWRVDGITHWLWCFASNHSCFYTIERSRGSPALMKFFTNAFDGTLVTDFWGAYGNVCAGAFQKCLAHLLRELEKVDAWNASAEWTAFSKKLRRLLRDAIRLRYRDDYRPEKYRSRIDRIKKRLETIAYTDYEDREAARLAKRLRKYEDQLLVFLEDVDVPFENNFAERMIRPAVIIRKNSQSNRSEQGAGVQAVLMTIYRTLKLRGHEPMEVMIEALRHYVVNGELPELP